MSMEGSGVIQSLRRFFGLDVSVGQAAAKDNQAGFFGMGMNEEAYSAYQEYMRVGKNRMELYKEYERMDETEVIGAILDMYADDATQIDLQSERTVWYESGDDGIEESLNVMLNTISVEEDISSLAREIAKNGDDFERLVYRSGDGILATHPVAQRLVHRKEDKTHKLQGFTQDGKKFRGGKDSTSYPWDYVHFRLRGRNRVSLYGTSLLYHLIRPWRMLIAAEDHALMYSLNRSPERNLFMIDVGTQDEHEAMKTIKRFQNAVRNNRARDKSEKSFDHRFNAVSPQDDVFMGIREGSNTRIDKMAGSSGIARDTLDLPYYLKKVTGAARISAQVFGIETAGTPYNPKASYANQDIQYARNVMRLQRAIKMGMKRLGQVHLLLKIHDGTSDDPEKTHPLDFRAKKKSFRVKMTPPSFIAELERLELEEMRLRLADQMVNMARQHEAFNSRNWVAHVLRDKLRMSDRVLSRILASKKEAGEREDSLFAGNERKELPGESPSDWGLVDGKLTKEEERVLNEIMEKDPTFRARLERVAEATRLGAEASEEIESDAAEDFSGLRSRGDVIEDDFEEDEDDDA